MSNPFDPNYLAEASAQFGPFAWMFFALQLAAVLGGLYILYVRTDTNAVRQGVWRQLATALLIVGGVGMLLGVLRLANLPVLNQRYWFYIQLVVELALAAYVFYYSRTIYPGQIAASQATRSRVAGPVRRANAPASRPAAARPASSGPPVPAVPRPIATTTRREARRERKRRSK